MIRDIFGKLMYTFPNPLDCSAFDIDSTYVSSALVCTLIHPWVETDSFACALWLWNSRSVHCATESDVQAAESYLFTSKNQDSIWKQGCNTLGWLWNHIERSLPLTHLKSHIGAPYFHAMFSRILIRLVDFAWHISQEMIIWEDYRSHWRCNGKGENCFSHSEQLR